MRPRRLKGVFATGIYRDEGALVRMISSKNAESETVLPQVARWPDQARRDPALRHALFTNKFKDTRNQEIREAPRGSADPSFIGAPTATQDNRRIL